MRIPAILLGAALVLTAGSAAADPLTGTIRSFFDYQPPPPPLGGDCGAIAAALGSEQTWYGEFSGKKWGYNDKFRPYAARGCFESEVACRVWQQQAITYAWGPIAYTSCRRGSPSLF